jgi:hypothetical protein
MGIGERGARSGVGADRCRIFRVASPTFASKSICENEPFGQKRRRLQLHHVSCCYQFPSADAQAPEGVWLALTFQVSRRAGLRSSVSELDQEQGTSVGLARQPPRRSRTTTTVDLSPRKSVFNTIELFKAFEEASSKPAITSLLQLSS